MINKKILVTGGAGFIGSNLIKRLQKQYPNNQITSLDNYFTGNKKNHVSGVEYLEGNTIDIHKIFPKRSFDYVFHFGEYSRIVYSFDDIEIVRESILEGTPKVLEACRKWGSKLIYSASSSKFGNNGQDENLSPYAWMKAKMVELIKNYNQWFDLQYEICYFFNVYGPGQITEGPYSTVVGIFERQFLKGEKCTVVKPGTQTRDFTHVDDIVSGTLAAALKNMNHEWHLRTGKNVSIIELAEAFGKWKYVPERRGERFRSEFFESDTEETLEWKPKHDLFDWINKIKENGST